MGYRIFIPRDIADTGKLYLKERGYEIILGENELDWTHWNIENYDGIIVRTDAITDRVIKAGKRLKIIARHGTGVDNVDIEAATRQGIQVTNTPCSNAVSVAESVIGAMLNVSRKTFQVSKAMRNGDFYYKNRHMGTDLEGKTLGIIGFGRIGKEVARRAFYGLNMNIMAYDPFVAHSQNSEYVRFVEKEELLQESDIVTLHIPASKDTIGFIGSKELELMKPEAYLINYARGGIVEERALISALREGDIAGAALDVFYDEPLPDRHPFFSLDNLLLTPHYASNTVETMGRMSLQAAEEIHRFFSGEGVRWPVNCVLPSRNIFNAGIQTPT